MEGRHEFEVRPEFNSGESKAGEITEKDPVGEESMNAMHKGRHPTGQNIEGSDTEQAGDDYQRQTIKWSQNWARGRPGQER